MTKDINVLDKDWLTKSTGNPFVDTGGFVIKYLQEYYYKDADIFKLIENVAKIYVYDWDAKLHSFFHNSTITQPAFKGERKIEETLKYYKALLYDEIPYEQGFCQITGRKTLVFPARADNSILAGSWGFVNFHSFFSSGTKVSKEVLIRLFFVPLGAIQIGGKIAVLNTSVPDFTEFFVANNVKNNLQIISAGLDSKGIFKTQFNNVENALFHFVDELLKKKHRQIADKKITITLYHFSSYMQSPSLDVYNLPADVFTFYSYCNINKEISDYWKHFVRSYYRPVKKMSGAKYDAGDGVYILEKRNEKIRISEDEFLTWHNDVLHRLFTGKSLLPYFIYWYRTGNYLPFHLIEAYLKIILKMKAQTINKIKYLADFIVQTGQQKGDIKHHLNALSSAGGAGDLRKYLLKLVRINYEEGNDEPLIRLDEYVKYLFSDEIGWQELRDVLLISVYERLHDLNIEISVSEEEN